MAMLRDALTAVYGEQVGSKLSEIAMYSGNFRGFTQLRKTLANENITAPFTSASIQ